MTRQILDHRAIASAGNTTVRTLTEFARELGARDLQLLSICIDRRFDISGSASPLTPDQCAIIEAEYRRYYPASDHRNEATARSAEPPTPSPRAATQAPLQAPPRRAATVDAPDTVVDASNVARASAGKGEPGKLAHLIMMREQLISEGKRPLFVGDSNLRWRIDDQPGYEAMLQSGDAEQAPAERSADWFILQMARVHTAVIVSNDRYKNYEESFPVERQRARRFMFTAGKLIIDPLPGGAPAEREGT